MPEWNLTILPSFEGDLEKYQVDQEKLDKWFLDLRKKPDYLNNAHALHGPLQPLWSAHFNERVNYIVIYVLCFGKESSCFLNRRVDKFSYIDPALVAHTCSKEKKRIYACKFGTHRTYKEL